MAVPYQNEMIASGAIYIILLCCNCIYTKQLLQHYDASNTKIAQWATGLTVCTGMSTIAIIFLVAMLMKSSE